MTGRNDEDPQQQVRARFIIVGSHRLYREALASRLATDGLTSAAQGNTLDEALAQVANGTELDLLIYILNGEATSAQTIAGLAQARARFSGLRTIILGETVASPALLEAVKIGVEAWLSKDISAQALQRSIELVLLGQNLFTSTLVQCLLTRAPDVNTDAPLPPRQRQTPAADRPASMQFSTREHQILRCLVDGLSNKVIARELDIAEATVKVHVKGLLRKTQMANRTQAAVWAMNHGLGAVAATREPIPVADYGTSLDDTRDGTTFPPSLSPSLPMSALAK